MADIKVKEKNDIKIKKFDKSVAFSRKLKNNIVSIKEKSDSLDNREQAIQDYGANQITDKSMRVAKKGVQKVNKYGKKTVKTTGKVLKKTAKKIKKKMDTKIKKKLKKNAVKRTKKTIKNIPKAIKKTAK